MHLFYMGTGSPRLDAGGSKSCYMAKKGVQSHAEDNLEMLLPFHNNSLPSIHSFKRRMIFSISCFKIRESSTLYVLPIQNIARNPCFVSPRDVSRTRGNPYSRATSLFSIAEMESHGKPVYCDICSAKHSSPSALREHYPDDGRTCYCG